MAGAVVAMLGRSEDSAIFHVSPARAAACTIMQMLDWSYEALSCHEDFRRRRVLKPLFAAPEIFDYLARTASTFSADVGPVIALVQPFAEQLFVHKDIDNARMLAAWPGFRLAPMPELVDRTFEWLIRSQWKTKEPA